jgi:hypothetical protein
MTTTIHTNWKTARLATTKDQTKREPQRPKPPATTILITKKPEPQHYKRTKEPSVVSLSQHSRGNGPFQSPEYCINPQALVFKYPFIPFLPNKIYRYAQEDPSHSGIKIVSPRV